MGRQPHLKAIEGAHAAVRAANKVFPVPLHLSSFHVLLSLYNASEKGQSMTKKGLMTRAFLLGNASNMGHAYKVVWWLIRKGFIEVGPGVQAVPTLQAKNYVRFVERWLRNLRMNDL